MKKICVFTGTRADYGILKPLMDELKKDEEFELKILATGSHLSPEFGLTYQEIEKDGFEIAEKVEILQGLDTPEAICKTCGVAMINFCDAIKRMQPDAVIILGDRYEALAFAMCCTIMKMPTVHLYGGEVTEGAYDDAFRHSITKMSHLHFTSTDLYRKRVIQLGEQPETVFNVGSLSNDNIKNLKFLTREELENQLIVKFLNQNLLVTYHPETLDNKSVADEIDLLLGELGKLSATFIIFTKANADTAGRIINQKILKYVSENPETSAIFDSLGQIKYLSVMKIVDAVVGNSSSGITEAPALKTPTINIGNRQKGRIRATSIIDINLDENALKNSLQLVNTEEFKQKMQKLVNPFGDGTSAVKIKKILKKFDLNQLKTKSFFDIDFNEQD